MDRIRERFFGRGAAELTKQVGQMARPLEGPEDLGPLLERIGFYRLDVYSLWESMESVIEYLERVDPDVVEAAHRAYRCFEPYGEDVREYARATIFVPTSCEGEGRNMALYTEMPRGVFLGYRSRLLSAST